jgi:hypothetical protein
MKNGKVFRFTCKTCGKTHEGSPSLSFDSPSQYFGLSDKDKKTNARLDSDFCVIENRDFFIRVILEIPIHDCEEPFTWGVWVSQSRPNFEAYEARFKKKDDRDPTFGWFSNNLPYYPETLNLKTMVHFQPKGLRPKLELEKNDHPLCLDFHNGISWEKAIEIAEIAMHASKKEGAGPEKKKWWKIF